MKRAVSERQLSWVKAEFEALTTILRTAIVPEAITLRGCEVANSAKAFELRKKEATELATQYAAGEISPEEANRRLVAYDRRWGEAIYGVSAAENLSDKQILDQIDQARSDTKRAFTAAITSRDIPRSGR